MYVCNLGLILFAHMYMTLLPALWVRAMFLYVDIFVQRNSYICTRMHRLCTVHTFHAWHSRLAFFGPELFLGNPILETISISAPALKK